MSSDLRALFAAIVADPSDDVARLVYADCLEEHGNAARAAFIRLQIEAERHHPDSNARAELEQQAWALFVDHWIEWWGAACTAVGLPRPTREPKGRLTLFAQRVGLRWEVGYPYEIGSFVFGCDVRTSLWALPKPAELGGWTRTGFRRGFPDTLTLDLESISSAYRALLRWATVSPLRSLGVYAPSADLWPEGPHLAGVRSLNLYDCDRTVLDAVFESPNLGQLEALGWLASGSTEDDDESSYQFADHVWELLQYPHLSRLNGLALQVWTDRAALAVAGCAHLAGLSELELDIDEPGSDPASRNRRLAMMAGAPCLAGLRSLCISQGFDEAGLEAVLRRPTWSGLRKLELDVSSCRGQLEPLISAGGLPELVELRLSGFGHGAGEVTALARSALLPRLRHLAVCGDWLASKASINFIRAMDADRIETLAIDGGTRTSSDVVAALRDRFGSRFRILL
jgi:uncharacterized protein (TIGR02996 family)